MKKSRRGRKRTAYTNNSEINIYKNNITVNKNFIKILAC
jgi:hypothetical protein